MKSSLPSNASEKGRFTFEVLAADGNKVKVAYNYHTAFSANFITMLKGLADNADIMVTGSMTYASDNEKAPNSFNPGNGGSWTIVPLDEAVAVQTLA